MRTDKYCDIATYFGKSHSWFSSRIYNRHKEKITSMFGVVSIQTIERYFDYQDSLISNIQDIIQLNLFTNKEIAEITKTKSYFYDGLRRDIFMIREEYSFLKYDFMEKLELIIEAAKEKIAEIEALGKRL